MSSPRLLQDAPLCRITASGQPAEPFGETPYLERIEYFAGQAHAKKQAGASYLLLCDMPNLHEARAALLGARTCGLPVYVLLAAAPDGKPWEPQALLAALLCLQELGPAAVGLRFHCMTADLLEQFALLWPYATVPLLAAPAHPPTAEGFAGLLLAGVELFCHQDFAPPLQQALAEAFAKTGQQHRPPRPDHAPLLLCDAFGVYYLEEDYTLSQEIASAHDMSEEILAQESLAVDALCFHVTSVDDALVFGRNAHMTRCAVCILAEQEEALEMALTLYTGRALVDARSDVAPQALQSLSGAYGAIVR